MSFVKDLLGGILIAIAAGTIALAQNAVRKDGIPLIPKATTPVVGRQEVPVPSSDDPTRSEAEAHSEGSPADRHMADDPSTREVSPATPTAEEFASGLVSRDRLKELLGRDRIVLIDARPPLEYETGHIAGAINVPYERFSEYYGKLADMVPYSAVIVCYCRSETCDDSENLARELKFMGYQNVMLYKGGWDEWSRAGYPAATATAHE